MDARNPVAPSAYVTCTIRDVADMVIRQSSSARVVMIQLMTSSEGNVRLKGAADRTRARGSANSITGAGRPITTLITKDRNRSEMSASVPFRDAAENRQQKGTANLTI